MNSRKLITILVLSVYLFHALLPLLYSTGNVHAEERPDYAFTVSQIAEQSVLEQNLSLVPEQWDKDHDSPSSAQVLLKKKRAIITSLKQLVVQLYPLYIRFSDLEPCLKTARVPSHIAICTNNCPDGFSYYHSGISPPSV